MVTTIRPYGCTPVSSFVYTYDSGTGYVLTNGINGDSLVSYNGKFITYDAVGNPVNYLGNTLTWNGRELASYTSADGNTKVTYTYDLDGVRTGKTVTEKVGTGAAAYTKTTEYSYTYEGITLLYEKRTETCKGSGWNNGNASTTVYELYYTYSGLGTLAKIDYSVTTTENGQSSTVSGIYSVVTNSRGDIERIIGSTGTVCAEYVYDAWGNLLETKALTASGTIGSTIADVNPVRYRGYYFDGETGLYYCIGRYYDAGVGRFVNADHPEYSATSPENLVQYNLYAYCLNNPLNRTDADGNWSLPNWAKVVVGAVALAGAIALTVATGGGTAAVAVGVAKVVGSVALSTAISAGTGYLTGGTQGAIDGACNGFTYGSLSALGGAAI